MGENSEISWTHHTFNIVEGCQKVSPACQNCYAERRDHFIHSKNPHWGPDAPRKTMSDNYWKQPRKWDKNAREAIERRRVFCSSLADVFEAHPTVNAERLKLWRLIKDTPNLDWLLLTKRPENVRTMLPPDWGAGYQNVWLGTTVELQEYADKRLPELLEIDATIHFVSAEPLLGEINLERYLYTRFEMGGPRHMYNKISWVICGGESGPSARMMNPHWARLLREQCLTARVAFHFKQWGEFLPDQQNPKVNVDNDLPLDYAGGTKVGKHEAGRELDGRTWEESPQVNWSGLSSFR